MKNIQKTMLLSVSILIIGSMHSLSCKDKDKKKPEKIAANPISLQCNNQTSYSVMINDNKNSIAAGATSTISIDANNPMIAIATINNKKIKSKAVQTIPTFKQQNPGNGSYSITFDQSTNLFTLTQSSESDKIYSNNCSFPVIVEYGVKNDKKDKSKAKSLTATIQPGATDKKSINIDHIAIKACITSANSSMINTSYNIEYADPVLSIALASN